MESKDAVSWLTGATKPPATDRQFSRPYWACPKPRLPDRPQRGSPGNKGRVGADIRLAAGDVRIPPVRSPPGGPADPVPPAPPLLVLEDEAAGRGQAARAGRPRGSGISFGDRAAVGGAAGCVPEPRPPTRPRHRASCCSPSGRRWSPSCPASRRRDRQKRYRSGTRQMARRKRAVRLALHSSRAATVSGGCASKRRAGRTDYFPSSRDLAGPRSAARTARSRAKPTHAPDSRAPRAPGVSDRRRRQVRRFRLNRTLPRPA